MSDTITIRREDVRKLAEAATQASWDAMHISQRRVVVDRVQAAVEQAILDAADEIPQRELQLGCTCDHQCPTAEERFEGAACEHASWCKLYETESTSEVSERCPECGYGPGISRETLQSASRCTTCGRAYAPSAPEVPKTRCDPVAAHCPSCGGYDFRVANVSLRGPGPGFEDFQKIGCMDCGQDLGVACTAEGRPLTWHRAVEPPTPEVPSEPQESAPSRYGRRGEGICDRCPNVGNLFRMRVSAELREYDTLVCRECRDKIRADGLDGTPSVKVEVPSDPQARRCLFSYCQNAGRSEYEGYCAAHGEMPEAEPAQASEGAEEVEHAATVAPNITGERAEVWLFGEYRVTATADVDDAVKCRDHLNEAAERWLNRRGRATPPLDIEALAEEIVAELSRHTPCCLKPALLAILQRATGRK